MTESISFTSHIGCPPDRVWAALTEPSLIGQWWGPGDVRPVVGHRFTLDMGAFGKQQCEVLDVETGRRFSYTFGEGFTDTTITWTLEPEDGGTRLTLEHSGFDTDSPMGRQAFEGMRAGWPMVISRIEPALGDCAGG